MIHLRNILFNGWKRQVDDEVYNRNYFYEFFIKVDWIFILKKCLMEKRSSKNQPEKEKKENYGMKQEKKMKDMDSEGKFS